MAGSLIYGELVRAQLHNSASDLTPTATGLIYFNTTGTTGPKWYTGSAWKTAADLDTAQVFTNKDFDGGTASNTSRVTLPKAATATLDALTRKEATLVYDTSTGQLKFDNGSALTALAATSLATPTASGVVTSYFATIQSAVSTVTNNDATSTTTDGFLIYAFSTGNTARVLTLPAASANVGRRIFVKKTDSGTGTVTVTRAGSDTIDGATTFVLTSQYDSVEIVCISSSAWSRVDAAKATSTQTGLISRETAWTSYTPTFGNLGTNTLIYAAYRQIGKSLEVIVRTNVTATGTAAQVTISIPGGFTIDTAVYGGGSSVAMLGMGIWLEGTPKNLPIWVAGTTSTSAVSLYRTDTQNALNGDSPANNHTIWAQFIVPVT